MKVVVTGGEGRLGSWVRRDLRDNGMEVVSVDNRLPATREAGIHHRLVHMDDLGEVIGALRGADALVHLAAIPAPYSHADEFVFLNNVRATFNAFQAASTVGIKRVVFASSASAYGMAWARPTFPPHYVPLDEAHPFVVLDPYALSKDVDERTARMFVDRDGMTAIGLRFHWISLPGEPKARAANSDKFGYGDATNLWGYIDIRDASRAVRLSLEAPITGFDAFNIIANDTLHQRPTMEILAEQLPDTEIRAPLPGFTSPWSNQHAKDVLGFTPAYSWRDED